MPILPLNLVIHRWCPRTPESSLIVIDRSRDGQLVHRARPETVEAFMRMREAAGKERIGLRVIWAFRDPALQREQFEEAKRKHGPQQGIRWLAPPGFSEHQTGWVLDLGDAEDPQTDDNPLFERTKAFQWLRRHAGDHGFELSFPPGNWQGISYEPWHWRFVGTRDARAAFHPTGWRWIWVWVRSWTEALRWWMHP